MSRIGKESPTSPQRRSPRLQKVVTSPIRDAPKNVPKSKREKGPLEPASKSTIASSPATIAVAPTPSLIKNSGTPITGSPASKKGMTAHSPIAKIQQQEGYSSPELNTMSRIDLQKIAKSLSIPHQQRTDVLINLLSEQKKNGVFHSMNVAMRLEHHGREPESPKPKELNMKHFLVSPSASKGHVRKSASGTKSRLEGRYQQGHHVLDSPPSSPTKLKSSPVRSSKG